MDITIDDYKGKSCNICKSFMKLERFKHVWKFPENAIYSEINIVGT